MVLVKTESEIEAIRAQIDRFCKVNKVSVYKTTLTSEESDLGYSGESAEDFLEIAKNLDTKIIYLQVTDATEIDENEASRAVILQIAFNFGNRFHKFTIVSGWYLDNSPSDETEEAEDSDKDESDEVFEDKEKAAAEAALKKILDMTHEEVVMDMLDFAKKNYEGRFFNADYSAVQHEMLDNYWATKGIPKYYQAASDVDLKMRKEKITTDIWGRFKKMRDEHEAQKLPGLIEKGVIWGKQNGKKKLSVAEVDVILKENDAWVTPLAKKKMHVDINLKLNR